jgi:hypothetical protein
MNDAQEKTERQAARRRGPISLFADFFLALQDRVLWPLADAVRGIPDALRRGVGHIAYGFRRVFVWPLTDRLALLGGPGRILTVAAVAVIVAVGVVALRATSTKDSTAIVRADHVADAPAPTVETTPAPVAKAPEPTLHGARPVFTPPKAKPAAKPKPTEPAESSTSSAPPAEETTGSGSAPAATEKISSFPTASRPSAAEAATIPGPTAGAEAISVAREFSGAFVVYETRGESSKVRKAFASTATPELTKALLKRPPRQPSGVKVPKAKVLNIVPGPSRGSVFTVSVSLLRVGVTSELRLEMEKLKKHWRVTNVLG